jgi:hypothetical protein
VVCITETDYVYCAVRIVPLNTIQVNFPYRDRSSTCGICGGSSGTEAGFVPKIQFPTVSLVPALLNIHPIS